jgi:hypothetical protein
VIQPAGVALPSTRCLPACLPACRAVGSSTPADQPQAASTRLVVLVVSYEQVIGSGAQDVLIGATPSRPTAAVAAAA